MTIGNQISDQRTSVTIDGTSCFYGAYFEKHWSGSDQTDFSIPYQDHPYYCDVWQFESYACSFRHPDGNTYTHVPAPDPPDFAVAQWTSNDDIALLNKLGNRIRGGDFNLGNFLGEHQQTLNLVATTATRVAKMLHYLKHGHLDKAAYSVSASLLPKQHTLRRFVKDGKPLRDPKLLSDAILEYQYGWKPLLGDVYSSMEVLANRNAMPFKHTFKVRRLITGGKIIDIGNCYAKHHVTHGVSIKVTMSTEPTLRDLLQLNNPLGVMWEVTPWSFVADWFLPIGGYLDAISVLRNFTFDTVVRSERVKGSSILLKSPLGLKYDQLKGTYKHTILHRATEPLSFVNVSPPVLKGFGKAFSAEHTLNALALLTSTTDGFRKQLKF